MFGDGKLQDLVGRMDALKADLDRLRVHLDGVEAKLAPEARPDPTAGFTEALRDQQRQIEQLRLDNIALTRQVEEQARQAQTTATALFQRIERVRSEA